jgi:hypothetical protein
MKPQQPSQPRSATTARLVRWRFAALAVALAPASLADLPPAPPPICTSNAPGSPGGPSANPAFTGTPAEIDRAQAQWKKPDASTSWDSGAMWGPPPTNLLELAECDPLRTGAPGPSRAGADRTGRRADWAAEDLVLRDEAPPDTTWQDVILPGLAAGASMGALAVALVGFAVLRRRDAPGG